MNFNLRGSIVPTHPYQLDKTLSIEGTGAESKATGEAIKELKKYADDHANNVSNPHKVTASQIGLGSVDNTPDMEKPVSIAQEQAIIDRFQIGTEKPNSNTLWFNQKEDIDQTDGDEHIMAVDLNMAQHRLTGLADPVKDNDAATKGYAVAKSNIVNNFTTTEEGYVADARALRACSSDILI